MTVRAASGRTEPRQQGATSTPLLVALWVGIALQLLGQVVDARWHAAHQAETALETWGEQLNAHWLLWIGAAVTLAVAAVALKRVAATAPFALVLGSAGIYVLASIWHGAEHARGSDPELAHVLLGLTKLGMLGGAIWATITARRAA